MNRSLRLIIIAVLLSGLAGLTYTVVRPFLVSIG